VMAAVWCSLNVRVLHPSCPEALLPATVRLVGVNYISSPATEAAGGRGEWCAHVITHLM
jgi:hypothetical protein